MAKKQETVDQETVDQEITEPAPYDPWQDMRNVYIPRRSRGEQATLEVGVNDKTYFVPKDKMVQVPAPLWEVITEMQKRQRIMEEEAKKDSGVREI